MIISLNWLRRYVDIPVDTPALVHDLTMLGLNVEHARTIGIEEPLVVVGHVVACEKHPDADRLSVCRVEVGRDEALEVVCGAPNVAAGQKVPVALVGAVLPGGLKIRRSKIRGVRSNGMICSAVELGLGEDSSGIIVLDGDPPVGTALSEVLGNGDTILEIEVTPNRPDQLSHHGVAREVAARYATALSTPHPEVDPHAKAKPSFTIDIENPDDCYRFTGRIVRGVSVGPSPAWLREKLESIGLKSINNIVDVSNYVMMELGQPLHAYDLDRLGARKLGARRGVTGEKVLALDDNEYEVDENCLLITDGGNPVGIAGVIGGSATRVTESTKDILIESAAFNPRVVRATRKHLNISTDASYRFERGSDRGMCLLASDRACELIGEVAGGTPGRSLDVYPAAWPTPTVTIRRNYTRRLLGAPVTTDEIAALLARLHFDITGTDDESVTVSVPSWRADIVEEADLVEEVARLYGYDRIGRGWKFRTTSFGESDPFDSFVEETGNHLAARGHTEILLSSFTDGREVARLGIPDHDRRSRPIEVQNPLSSNHSYLRTTLLAGALDVVRHNIDHGTRYLRLFAPGAVFLHSHDHSGGLPEEPARLLLIHTRPAGADFWNDLKKRVDLFDIKGEVESLLATHHVDFRTALEYDFDAAEGRFTWRERDRLVIEGGIVPAAMARDLHLDQPVWYAEIDMGALFELRPHRLAHRPLAGYPASRRDLSLLTPPAVPYEKIEKSLAKNGGRLLESIQVFDVYRGAELPGRTTAIGVRLLFRSNEKTLTDADVDAVVDRMLVKLESELGVALRS